MEIHDTRDVLDVRNATVANSRFDDVNLSDTHFQSVNLSAAAFDNVVRSNARGNPFGTVFHDVKTSDAKIENAQVAGLTINGVSVRDPFAAYEAAKPAGGK